MLCWGLQVLSYQHLAVPEIAATSAPTQCVQPPWTTNKTLYGGWEGSGVNPVQSKVIAMSEKAWSLAGAAHFDKKSWYHEAGTKPDSTELQAAWA